MNRGAILPPMKKLLILISTNSDHDYLIRRGREIADRCGEPWLAVWVDTGQVPTQKSARRLQSAFSLAAELGGRTAILRGPSTFQAIMPFIVEHCVETVLVGAGTRHRFMPWRKRLYRQLIESGLPLEVSVISPPPASAPATPLSEKRSSMFGSRRGYGVGGLAVLAATALALGLENWIHNTNLVLVYVLAVVATGLRYGSRPAMAASVLSFLCFNFFLIEPRYSLQVARRDELATLIFLFLIAIVCGPVASRIRRQFLLLREANRYSETMRDLGQALSIAENAEAVWLAAANKLSATLQVESCIVVVEQSGRPTSHPEPSCELGPVDSAALAWTLEHGLASGHLTDTLSASTWTMFPVCKEGRCIACAMIRLNPVATSLAPYDRDLIRGMLQQVADTWRRIQLVGDLETARLQTEVEQLRSALLSSVSHDLKSPLAAMMGAAESLRLLDKQLEPQDRRDLVDTILQESRRLDSYIQNLLDMTRLGYGTLKIERDWVSVADILGSALKRLKRYYPDVRTDIRLPGAVPVLYVHAALIEQALFNILENAARFSPAHEKIQVSVVSRDNQCAIAVEDRGPGIPESLREKIFDMFYVVADGDQKQQSTGMGLAICRGMIGAHGGSVRAGEGAYCRGARIVVELPVDRPPSDDPNIEEQCST